MATMAVGLALLLAAPQATGSSSGFLDSVRVGAPIARGNLTVFPLSLRRAAAAEDHLMLDEALARRQIVVEEAGADGSVDALEVVNRSDRPVVLVGGELLLGGKQDRIVARSLVLRPRSRTQVPVFCVEHGRWSGGRSFELAGAMGHTELRKLAMAGDQQRVWNEVARENARLGAATPSGTYRAAARKLDADVGPLAREVAAELARDASAAGIAVAIDGEVVAVEWFASPRLFARIREKLVASYAAQARPKGSAAPSPAVSPPSAAAVADFAAKAERGDALIERARGHAGGAAVQTTYLKR